MVGIAMPPKADDPWLDPNLLGDRPRAASGRRQKNYPRPLQIALQRYRRATARLKHLAIFPRMVDFSRFGYHPYLESRLTIQEKWVLVLALATRARANCCSKAKEKLKARGVPSPDEGDACALLFSEGGPEGIAS